MNITITGASGFLGQKLAYGLLSANALTDSAGSPSRVEHLTLLDVVKDSLSSQVEVDSKELLRDLTVGVDLVRVVS